MQKMAQSHVFLSGVGGLGVEIGKLGSIYLSRQKCMLTYCPRILSQNTCKADFRCNKHVRSIRVNLYVLDTYELHSRCRKNPGLFCSKLFTRTTFQILL